MAKESRYDSYELIPPDIGLWETKNPVDDSVEYFTACNNCVITPTRSRMTRPGFSLQVGDILAASRIERIWQYNCLTASGDYISYYIISVRNSGVYKLYYKLAGTGGTWTAVTSLRSCNDSRRVHTITFSRNLAYVKSYPASGTGEYLGTVILDGTASVGTIVTKPWGLLGPSDGNSPPGPAKIVGEVCMLTAEASATATTLTVDSTTGFPSPAGTLWIGQERVTYTGTTATTFTGVTRGTNGTIADIHPVKATVRWLDWSASTHQVTVTAGWYYSYAYKSITGAVSNRADIETNPDLAPSFTGPFVDLIPEIIVQGHADTTNIPTIQIYRTTNGSVGGFHLLEEIANTGAGDITYIDDSYASGATSSTFNDPVPDSLLDTATFVPTLTSNSPPPTVNPPEVIGIDEISLDCFAMCTHLGRIFFSVSNYLYFSAFTELTVGIPEESFATDIAEGGANYFAFNEPISGLVSVNDALWVFTTLGVYRTVGYTKDSFSFTKVFDIGCKLNRRAEGVAAYNGKIAFVATTGAVYMIYPDGNIERISDPLDFSNYATIAGDIGLYFYHTTAQELLYMSILGYPSVQNRTIYVYDVFLSAEKRRPIWAGSWELPLTHVAFAAFPGGTLTSNGAVLAANGGSTSSPTVLLQLDEGRTTAAYDLDSVSAQTYFTSNIVTMPIRIPPGNHVNTFNRPTRDVKATRIFTYNRPTSGNYIAPVIQFIPDNWNSGTQPNIQSPPRVVMESPGSYQIQCVAVDKDVYRVKVNLTGGPGQYMEVYGMAVEFEPHYTATNV